MLTAKLDLTVTPNTLTVTSDKRIVSVDVTVLGETVKAEGRFPITIKDARTAVIWTLKSDNGTTAVYTASV